MKKNTSGNRHTELDSAPFSKTGYFICFSVYMIITGMGYAEKLSEKWIGWIDIVCLLMGLFMYIADTSGFLEKRKRLLPIARTITLATIALSLSIHIFTQTNMLAYYGWFVALAVVLCVIVVAAGLRIFFEKLKGRETS